MVPFGGWDMPVQYSGVIPEHKAVRSGVGVFDVSHMARLSFAGPDALALLEDVFTNSVAGMKDTQVRYGLVCNESGGILDDVLVYKWPYGYAMVVNAGNREKILNWLDVRKAGKNVQIMDQTFDTTMIAAQGPRAISLASGLFEADISALKYYFAIPTRYQDKGCVVSRTGYTGEDGFEAMVPNAVGPMLWDELIAKGAVPCGLGARDTLRLEAAMPLYGHELTEEINPFQAGLSWAVKLEKGPFVGRETLVSAALDKSKPTRVGLVLGGKRAAREGSPILKEDDTPVGTVTSGSYAPHLDRSIAMGYVPREQSVPGTGLKIDIRGTAVPATVIALPFYKRAR
jgi:aminomethyltransferase